MAREGRRPRRDKDAGPAQAPFRPLRNPYPPFEILSADQIESIHHASLQVLAEIGMNFLLEEARQILKDAGCAVDATGTRVRFDPAWIEAQVALAPAAFTLHARNPERSVHVGDNAINFSLVASAPHVSDLEGGRRTGNFADYCNLLEARPEPQHLPHARRAIRSSRSTCRPRPATSMRSRPWRRSPTGRLYGYALGAVRIRTRSRSPGSRARRRPRSCSPSPR